MLNLFYISKVNVQAITMTAAQILTVCSPPLSAKAHEKEPEAGWHLSDGPLKSGHGVRQQLVHNTSEDLCLCVCSD